MRVFDASSIIAAWDNYPIDQFPKVWVWLQKLIEDGRLLLPEPALDEIGFNSQECSIWLKKCGIRPVPVTEEILTEAMRIKNRLGVVEDRYHAKGVDENDLLIIASAKVLGKHLVSDESQLTPPQNLSKRKIPSVCSLSDVNVPCGRMIHFIKSSSEIF